MAGRSTSLVKDAANTAGKLPTRNVPYVHVLCVGLSGGMDRKMKQDKVSNEYDA